MTRKFLIDEIRKKKTYLCVGLDTDLNKIPTHLQSHPDAILEFNKLIIDATKDLCIAYKINTAFYEAIGARGWEMMQQTVDYIPSTHLKIADAKRGDIGNTSSQYARAFFETLNFDAITVAPYMGEDSIRPFLEYENKWTIVLGLTSNPGAADFELQKVETDIDELTEGVHIRKKETSYLYETVIKKVSSWGAKENLMFVVGATKANDITSVRKIIPENFLLVPGVGAQGGSLSATSESGLTKDCGLLVNVSRNIIYASDKEDFTEKVKEVAQQYQHEMESLLRNFKFI
jgi:orotidine-5'-phosphate decarboxylase